MNGMALCAGAGGLELGLRIALGDDYRCVVYVEREAYAAATLVARMADEALDTAPVWDDLLTFDGRPWRGVIHLVSAGFSCQPWSSAGKRLGIADERWLWPDIDRVIREVGPEWVFLENVPGLVHGGIEHVLGSLAAQGFAAEWDCVSASEVGAPHMRERLFILAHSSRQRSREARGLRNGSPLRPSRSGVGLADAARFGWGEISRSIRAGQSGVGNGSESVADTDSAGFGSIGSLVVSINGQASLRDHVDGRSRPSVALDYSDTRRCGRQDDEVRPGRSRPGRTEPLVVGDADERGHAGRASKQRRGPVGRTSTERTGEQLGSPNCSRLPSSASERPQRFTANAGYWPPDRSYTGGWPEGLEPAIRRVADGMAPWVDRLRLTGNGVVPLGAAVAFLRLRARLMELAA